MLRIAHLIAPIENTFPAPWLEHLPASMQEEAERFVFDSDKIRFAAARWLAWHQCGDGAEPKVWLDAWKTGEFGRPYVPGSADFNLTHSGAMVALSTADQITGLDVEQIREIDLDLFGSYMTDAQWEEIRSSKEPFTRFFHYWTIKEAVMKALGLGFRLPLEEIELRANDRALVRGKTWHLKSLDLEPGYAAHIATEEPLSDWESKRIEAPIWILDAR